MIGNIEEKMYVFVWDKDNQNQDTIDLFHFDSIRYQSGNIIA